MNLLSVERCVTLLVDRLAEVEDALLVPRFCEDWILAWDSGLAVSFEFNEATVTAVLYGSALGTPDQKPVAVPVILNARGRRAELMRRGDALAHERLRLLAEIEALAPITVTAVRETVASKS